MYGVGFHAGAVLGACFVVVLGTITVDAGAECAEGAGEDSAVFLAGVRLETVGDACWAADLASLASGGCEFAVVSAGMLMSRTAMLQVIRLTSLRSSVVRVF